MKLGMMEDIYIDNLIEGHEGVKSKMATKMATISLHTWYVSNYTT